MTDVERVTWEEFLDLYEEMLKYPPRDYGEKVYVDKALLNLLRRFVNDLPPLSYDRLHKHFRQCDAVDHEAPEGAGGCMDMAIWSLLYVSDIFWDTREEFLAGEVNG